ncbi:MAG: hypothetical protein K2G29_04690 [Muribaculaceae bacterium]|nr:hypothetical protein [Muribaculaceae bacterium]
MKRLIIKFIYLFLVSALLSTSVSATQNSQDAYLVTLSDDSDQPDDEDRDNRPENENKGRRDFIWSTTCSINPDRIEISSIDKECIISYDIYDQYGQCIGIFCNETDFLSAVFTIKGKLKIRIVLDSFSLSGNLEVV